MKRFVLATLFLACACSNKDTTASDASIDGTPADTGMKSDTGSNCGASSATVNGMLLGTTLAAKDAVYVPPAGGGSGFMAIVDFASACSVVQKNANKASSNVLVFTFTGGPPTVGTINVGSSTLDVQYAQYDATCMSPMGESATTGSITISKADACGITGTYDVTLSSDHVTGAFTAGACAIATDAGTTCQ